MGSGLELCDCAVASRLSLIPSIPISRILRPTTDSAAPDSCSTMANRPVNCPFKKNAVMPRESADIPWPTPQITPIFAPLYQDSPKLGAIKAAR